MKTNFDELNGEQRPATRCSLLLRWLPLCLAVAWAGCKSAEKGAADINSVGTYTLLSVDGNKVPCTLTHGGHTMAVKSGVFIINADGTCSSKISLSLPARGDANREVKASYTRAGATLTMKWEGAGRTTGTVKGDTFTMNNEGMVFAYRK